MPEFHTLIDAQALLGLLADGHPVVLLDARFELADPHAGARAYQQGHLPGARLAHLDDDLAGPRAAGHGRHPLPAMADWARTLGGWGITPAHQVVAYDAHGGAFAARAWWMLHWIGHTRAAVLDGGLAAWAAAGGEFEPGPAAWDSAPDYPLPDRPGMPTIDTASLALELGRWCLIDARSPERFRGEVEPLDPVAGHIPGALLRPFQDNLGPDGRFLPGHELRRQFEAYGVAPGEVVHQCGSGVTACHNLLAMTHAGLEGARLYPGSWSAWCADPSRPCARG